MNLEDRVEYQTGIAEFGIGKVAAFDNETEIVTVTDEDDGSTWCGPADLTTPYHGDEVAALQIHTHRAGEK